jgi:hypothetical protein
LRISIDAIARAVPLRLTAPIEVEFRKNLFGPGGEAHAAADLRNRRIYLATGLGRNPAERRRILIHELFHFVWIRLGNPKRREWEEILQTEFSARTSGELGWSAAWRKAGLGDADRANRTRRWREYTVESFCDTAAWHFSGLAQHDEFTLAARHRRNRANFFAELNRNSLPI